ncbi:Phosphoribosylaminoimidazole carboxylase, catalytic subunit [Elusimicrobium minutum Pei191]|uniref:N5-carboxyaminoimidazole ribonucleotide mutase n=1 Tax=Elusimicrobium minutum (strain Pei191) TaxID=445932 RepID=B2KCF4_ELUMP|nr:5-(carboxyamino)imidazole ribonucleotide mutase [Elusimicrobium minutum]ACC98075.1 Phosphoribosylaminoimidazole carboxylase, catalytic subunit [Elusimicrobium minutum Pei191]
MTKVLILMGSQSDLKTMQKASDFLKEFGVKHSLKICSAHRSPKYLHKLMEEYEEADVFIAGAGMAAHLAGVVASLTVKPVIGVPLSGGALNGIDALYSTVQMPPGMPVATVAVDGAKNAAVLAVQILALKDKALNEKLVQGRILQEKEIIEKNKQDKK